MLMISQIHSSSHAEFAFASIAWNRAVSLFVCLLKCSVFKWVVWRGWICSQKHSDGHLSAQEGLNRGHFHFPEQGCTYFTVTLSYPPLTFRQLSEWGSWNRKIWYEVLNKYAEWWDFRFSRRRVWRWLSSGMLRHVVWYIWTDVSEMLTASNGPW
jgi:hypothetical protein